MGDRANVYIHDGDEPGVYLYTHWNAWCLPQEVATALATDWAHRRRNDQPYLTRIIFDQLTGGVKGELGFGISAVVGDGDYRIIDVDTATCKVTHVLNGERKASWDFDYYATHRPHWDATNTTHQPA